MMSDVDFLTHVHTSTSRDYIARVTEFPKAEAASMPGGTDPLIFFASASDRSWCE